MNTRAWILSAALVAVLGAGGYHWHATQVRSRADTIAARARSDAKEARRLADETSLQVAAARRGLEELAAAPVPRSAPPPASAAAPTTTTKTAAVPPDPEVRRLQVQSFVSEQRLRYTALLKRVGFSSEKQREFDRIQDECRQVELDPAQGEASRQQARQLRDARLKDLFGPAHDQWLEANRHQPARAIVAQVVQQTFQGSGALTTTQADQLTGIVARHRLPATIPPSPGPARYDWDQIIAGARPFLNEQQLENFVAAIEYRRASDQMAAIAAKKSP
jgi:hypothetical protein